MSTPFLLNLIELQDAPLHLQGLTPSAGLGLQGLDELIRPAEFLEHDLQAEWMEDSVLVRGSLRLVLHCECARCLKPFDFVVDMPEWAAHLALEGEDPVPVTGDAVDLTPQIREDILLQLPQRPLCEPECRGLSNPPAGSQTGSKAAGGPEAPSPWAELDKLKLKD